LEVFQGSVDFTMFAKQLRDIYLHHLDQYEKDAASSPDNLWEGISEEEIVGFGYGQGPIQNLHRFRLKAKEFKQKWNLEECSDLELERIYWRLVDSGESRVVAEYGNDLSVVQYGSGFPQSPADHMSEHPWNLNVLPKMPTSLFHHSKEVIHGVTDPMLYFGMMFTSFAWHVEDHFLYSINFHHGGAPKIWYGVGSDHAMDLEAVMKKELPELFDRHPDLMHQLVTMISPEDLKRSQVPVFKAVQNPGEFVVTFPRGYHGGFNSGFNVAEAVNFAMPDWIPAGVSALTNYSDTHRRSAFSHEELILSCARSFPVTHVAVHLLQELYRLTKDYDRFRHEIYKEGVNRFAKIDEATEIETCSTCQVDCYFAYIRCGCSAKFACAGCWKTAKICRGMCQGGPYLVQRVAIELLESLIRKMETRLDLVNFARLSGCKECVPSTAAPLQRKAHIYDTKRRVLTLTQRLARKGGLREDSSEQIDVPSTHKKWFSFAEEHQLFKRRNVATFSTGSSEETTHAKTRKSKKRDEKKEMEEIVKVKKPKSIVIDLTN
jgi:hypothetical protein